MQEVLVLQICCSHSTVFILSEVGFDDQVAKLKDRAAKRRAYLEKQEDGPAKQTNE